MMVVMVSFASSLPSISAGIGLQWTHTAAAARVIIKSAARGSSKSHVTSPVNLFHHALKN
jgi:hypothetical protein